MPNNVHWLSHVPGFCETCGSPIKDTFFDSAVMVEGRRGPWAIMCPSCFTFGPGHGKLGLGLGQKYEKQPDGKWLKTEG